MSDMSETTDRNRNIITTEKGKRIKRGPTSLHIDQGLWQEVRIMAVLKGKSVTDYVERALRKQIDEDNREAGKQGYKVGQGGMYIPPPPSATPQQPSQSQADEIRESIADAFSEIINRQSPEEEITAEREKEKKEIKRENFDESISK